MEPKKLLKENRKVEGTNNKRLKSIKLLNGAVCVLVKKKIRA